MRRYSSNFSHFTRNWLGERLVVKLMGFRDSAISSCWVGCILGNVHSPSTEVHNC